MSKDFERLLRGEIDANEYIRLFDERLAIRQEELDAVRRDPRKKAFADFATRYWAKVRARGHGS